MFTYEILLYIQTMIVLEYLPNGDLRSYLTKMQPTYVYVKIIC